MHRVPGNLLCDGNCKAQQADGDCITILQADTSMSVVFHHRLTHVDLAQQLHHRELKCKILLLHLVAVLLELEGIFKLKERL